MGSTSLNLARALVLLIGGGALLMSITGLLNGEELTDPVFPAGLLLGVLAVGAGAWVATPGWLQTIVTWLGLAGLVVALLAFGRMAVNTPSPDVLALFLVPAAIVLAAVARMARARVAVPSR